ncbi:MAG: SirB2 family protein [Betaproteobacteria bacterium]|nr:SirB2 family protein [Betaproteobacteria bacterium]
MYLALKHLHVTCVALSGGGFLLRGLLMALDSPWLKSRPARIFPHVVDTLLLGSALGLAYVTAQYPFVQGWLTAKVLGLLAYILCGTVALKRGRSKAVRLSFFVLAVLVFAYIVSVALSRNAAGFLLFLR